MLFSATMPQMLLQFTRAGLKNPEMIRLDVDTKISENLRVCMCLGVGGSDDDDDRDDGDCDAAADDDDDMAIAMLVNMAMLL